MRVACERFVSKYQIASDAGPVAYQKMSSTPLPSKSPEKGVYEPLTARSWPMCPAGSTTRVTSRRGPGAVPEHVLAAVAVEVADEGRKAPYTDEGVFTECQPGGGSPHHVGGAARLVLQRVDEVVSRELCLQQQRARGPAGRRAPAAQQASRIVPKRA